MTHTFPFANRSTCSKKFFVETLNQSVENTDVAFVKEDKVTHINYLKKQLISTSPDNKAEG